MFVQVEQKELSHDKLIAALKEEHNALVTHQNGKTADLVHSIKWRIEDCETKMQTRVT